MQQNQQIQKASSSVLKYQNSLSVLRENKISLVLSLRNKELSQILESPPDLKTSICLVRISNELTFSTIMNSPLMHTLDTTLGEKTVLKILCFVLCQLNDSIKVSEKMNAPQILQVAYFYTKKYTHDTLDDFILALQTMKIETDFYRGIGEHHIYKALEAHFDRKSNFFETQNYNYKTKELENSHMVNQNICQNVLSLLTDNQAIELRQKNGVFDAKNPLRLPKPIFDFSISNQTKKEYQKEYNQFVKSKK